MAEIADVVVAGIRKYLADHPTYVGKDGQTHDTKGVLAASSGFTGYLIANYADKLPAGADGHSGAAVLYDQLDAAGTIRRRPCRGGPLLMLPGSEAPRYDWAKALGGDKNGSIKTRKATPAELAAAQARAVAMA